MSYSFLVPTITSSAQRTVKNHPVTDVINEVTSPLAPEHSELGSNSVAKRGSCPKSSGPVLT